MKADVLPAHRAEIGAVVICELREVGEADAGSLQRVQDEVQLELHAELGEGLRAHNGSSDPSPGLPKAEMEVLSARWRTSGGSMGSPSSSNSWSPMESSGSRSSRPA